jgi:hypothetical protein
MLTGILIFIGVIAIWLVWSRYAMNKEIGIEFDMVQKDNPIFTNVPAK